MNDPLILLVGLYSIPIIGSVIKAVSDKINK